MQSSANHNILVSSFSIFIYFMSYYMGVWKERLSFGMRTSAMVSARPAQHVRELPRGP